MDLIRRLWGKRESFSAHMAWGALLALFVAARADGPLLGTAVALFAGFAWEVATERLSAGKWRPNLLDVLPWLAGGGLGALLSLGS